MCGRYVVTKPFAFIAKSLDIYGEFFDDEGNPRDLDKLTGRYNVAPSQDVPAVLRDDDGKLVPAAMSWGFVPLWAGAKAHPINARDDALLASKLWHPALTKRRCVLLADGFFEWLKLDAKRKQPIYFRREGGEPFGLAGLFNRARDGTLSCAHITTRPNDLVAPVHDRMPVMLQASDCQTWLDPDADRDALMSVLRPFDGPMTATPVSTRVNSPRHDGPSNVEPMTDST